MNYPAPEQILNPSIVFPQKVLKLIHKWKKNYWTPATEQNNKAAKFNSLTVLIDQISNSYGIKQLMVRYDENSPTCSFFPDVNTIVIDKNLSIISTLHELAHAIWGSDEKIACRWSVQLFAQTFPKAYAKLKWNGHRLVK